MKTALRTYLPIILFFFLQNVVGQPYTIPWAQQQPTWVFPMWFEDGNGDKDTIYYCVDSLAVSGNCTLPDDSIFGEQLIEVPPGKFSALFESQTVSCFQQYKVAVNPYLEYNGTFISGVTIFFCNAVMPLTLHWDKNLFYSSAIPLPDLFPAPKVEGMLWFDFPMYPGTDCFFEAPVLMTDTITNPFVCYRTDSVVFSGSSPSSLYFALRTWTGEWVGTTNLEIHANNFLISPNPVRDALSITIYANNKSLFQIEVYDVLGYKKLSFKSEAGKLDIDVSFFQQGMYFLKVIDPDGHSLLKSFLKF